MEDFKNLKRVAMNELRNLNSQYANKEEFSEGDAKRYDCLMHGLKCQLTAEAMLESKYESEPDYSGSRGRNQNTERYISRDAEQSMNRSYTDGYSEGYSEAMSQINGGGNSGHYPMPPYYPRRW